MCSCSRRCTLSQSSSGPLHRYVCWRDDKKSSYRAYESSLFFLSSFSISLLIRGELLLNRLAIFQAGDEKLSNSFPSIYVNASVLAFLLRICYSISFWETRIQTVIGASALVVISPKSGFFCCCFLNRLIFLIYLLYVNSNVNWQCFVYTLTNI